jgi:pimeloyl-ACP methyl ester carboxylesterase
VELKRHAIEEGRSMSTEECTGHVISTDGTPIAYWRSGQGPPLVLVHGTSADHTRWEGVLPLLAAQATVYAVDRRGRGSSGDAEPYAIEQEFADVAAVVDAVAEAEGAPVNLMGHSSGALFSVEAARLTGNLARLLLYEPGFPEPEDPSGFGPRAASLLAEGRREEMLELFFREVVQVSEEEVELLKGRSSWPGRVAAAHTILREEHATYEFEPGRFGEVTVPTLMLMGGDTPAFITEMSKRVAAALPEVTTVVMPGQQHVAMDTGPELLVGAVLDFLHS